MLELYVVAVVLGSLMAVCLAVIALEVMGIFWDSLRGRRR